MKCPFEYGENIVYNLAISCPRGLVRHPRSHKGQGTPAHVVVKQDPRSNMTKVASRPVFSTPNTTGGGELSCSSVRVCAGPCSIHAGNVTKRVVRYRLPYSKLAPSWICFHIGPFAAAPSAPAAARLATLRAASFISKATSKVFSSNDA